MRSRSRALIRDASYAKRAKTIVVNNIIGSGIGVQAQVKTSRDSLNSRVNDEIEALWNSWSQAEFCHTGGSLHFPDIERQAMGQVFETGEIFIRKHYRSFGGSGVPFALEIIEPERVLDDMQPLSLLQNAKIRMGVETDEFYRPLAYWIRKLHPGELRVMPGETDAIERIPAEQMLHLRIIDRWPQTRGEPWLHTVIRKLNDLDSYTEAEIIAARASASYMATIETPQDWGDQTSTGGREVVLEPGMVERLAPGEKFTFHTPNRPNQQIDPFMRLLLREIAAGTGASYESLSKDYSQSNYSSSRLALLDDRDLWRAFQSWFIRYFRIPVHRDWMQQAVFSGTAKTVSVEAFMTDPEKFCAVRFKPRGWTWIDPEKEVAAYKEAIRCGFTTTTDVISLTGGGKDIEDVLDERRQELNMMAEKDLMFDTDPDAEKSGKQEPPEPVKKLEEEEPPKRLKPVISHINKEGSR